VVTIKFYGLIREAAGRRSILVEARTVGKALRQACEAPYREGETGFTLDRKGDTRFAPRRDGETGVDETLLREALIFLNGKPLTGIWRLRRRLRDGDELALLSPAGGG